MSSTITKLVHLKKSRYDVLIARPSKWGNPFTVAEYGRGACIELYREWLYKQIVDGAIIEDEILELDGKVLGCWCHPKPCHGDVLIEVINKIKFYRKIGSSFREHIMLA